MSTISAAERNKLPSSALADPARNRAYPLVDKRTPTNASRPPRKQKSLRPRRLRDQLAHVRAQKRFGETQKNKRLRGYLGEE